LVAQIPLAEPIEISMNFRGKFPEIGLTLDDGDLEVTGSNLPLDGLGGEEGNRLADQIDFGAPLADEFDLQFPVVQSDHLD
jgi:hypothetical protein